MDAYRHVVQYYETDKMGITHHSNYIRWMEEARIDYLSQTGLSYARLEERGLLSPVLSVSGRYRHVTSFPEEIFILVSIAELRGVKLKLAYTMHNAAGKLVFEGESEHTFLNRELKPVRLKKDYPDLYEALLSGMENAEEAS